MLLNVIIVASSAVVVFVWGCATVPTVARATIGALTRPATEPWTAVMLAISGAAMWTMCALAALILSMIAAPHTWLTLIYTRLTVFGAAAGLAAWLIAAVSRRRLPRFGQGFELTTAMTLVSLFTEEPTKLASIEQIYRRFAAPDA